MKKIITFLFFFVLSLLACMTTALAYIDPSAMTFLIQVIAGVVIAAGAALGFYFRRIKRAIKNRGKKNEDEEEYEDDGDDSDDDDEFEYVEEDEDDEDEDEKDQ